MVGIWVQFLINLLSSIRNRIRTSGQVTVVKVGWVLYDEVLLKLSKRRLVSSGFPWLIAARYKQLLALGDAPRGDTLSTHSWEAGLTLSSPGSGNL